MRGNHAKAKELESRARHNRLTADQLIANGADEEFVQELRDRAATWEAQAALLRSRAKKDG